MPARRVRALLNCDDMQRRGLLFLGRRKINAVTAVCGMTFPFAANPDIHNVGFPSSRNLVTYEMLGTTKRKSHPLAATTERLLRFARKPISQKLAAIRATFFEANAAERRRTQRLLEGPHAAPRVFQGREKIYVAYRPDADVVFNAHEEISDLSQKWIKGNEENNSGDLPRLYALALNVKQVLNDNVFGDIAELGVYRGNSAAVLAHYARIHQRTVYLFDTFAGFDERDLVGIDESKAVQFGNTSLDQVRELVGTDSVTFVDGRFPQSIPHDLYGLQYSLVHIDCDLYEPAKAGLEFFYPRVSPGGLLIIHDYANPYWGGIKRAVDEYCRELPEKPIVIGDKSGTAMIRKQSGPARR